MRGNADVAGLSYYQEASHFLILLETADTLAVVEILHGRMDLDRHLRRLAGEDAPDAGNKPVPENRGRFSDRGKLTSKGIEHFRWRGFHRKHSKVSGD